MRALEVSFPLLLSFLITVSVANAAPEVLVDRPARNSSRDVRLPRALVEKIESDYLASQKKSAGEGSSVFQRQLLNISAELRRRAGSPLHEDVRVNTPLGGGVLDLADFVIPLRGSFLLKFQVHKEDGTVPQNLRVYYISQARQRLIEGESFAAGCGKYMDISSYYAKSISRGGITLYTAEQRYLSVIGGTFVTVAFEKEALYVASLSFLDSRYPELLCE